MPYSFTTTALIVSPLVPALPKQSCSCHQAQKLCAPSFVFSISGQVGFRHALLHLVSCSTHACAALRTKTITGMKEKLQWLFTEQVFLGCIHVQPYLYGSRRILFSRQNWSFVASHLASCPRESCASLRRAVLLNIRRQVNPQFHRPQAAASTDED